MVRLPLLPLVQVYLHLDLLLQLQSMLLVRLRSLPLNPRLLAKVLTICHSKVVNPHG